MSKSKAPDLNDLAPIYMLMMGEIKRRIAAVEAIIQPTSPTPVAIIQDSAYLQLRKICELIALSCLIVHGEIEELRSSKLRKAYNAEELVSTLSRLHPDFYPVPGRQIKDENTGRVVRLEPVSDPHLTKADLLRLYRAAGGHMHAGSVKSIVDEAPEPIDINEIVNWINRIKTLLGHHQIQTVKPDVQLWTIISVEGTDEIKSFTFLKKPAS